MFLITGGGSGIGEALAKALSRRDKEVLIIGRREDALVKVASFSEKINYLCADIKETSGRKKISDFLKDKPDLEGLIHNAGIIEPIAPLGEIEEASWNNIMATNLNAPLFLTQSLLPKLDNGRVLHIGSGVAYFPVQAWAGYCVSKAALSMLTRCFQLEMKNPYFTSVMPGIIDTPMQDLVRDSQGMDKEKAIFFKELKNENRLINPETVALFLSWLLLDVDNEHYFAKEWDIYDTSHHASWLPNNHSVPPLE